jgi:hypothetical protein
MPSDGNLTRMRSTGRAILWVVLAVLAISAVYTASIAITNWRSIGV